MRHEDILLMVSTVSLISKSKQPCETFIRLKWICSRGSNSYCPEAVMPFVIFGSGGWALFFSVSPLIARQRTCSPDVAALAAGILIIDGIFRQQIPRWLAFPGYDSIGMSCPDGAPGERVESVRIVECAWFVSWHKAWGVRARSQMFSAPTGNFERSYRKFCQ